MLKLYSTLMSSKFKTIKMYILNTFVNLVVMTAVFEIYFSSPIEDGMVPIKAPVKPIAKRIFVIVADGLPAEAVLGENENRVPFLTSIRKTRGSWGVSHASPPTESRTGHIAIFSGINEDPSSIINYWVFYTRSFDIVLRYSTHTWVLGTPDILFLLSGYDRFTQHEFPCNATGDACFRNATTSDDWIFSKIKDILTQELYQKHLREPGNIFVLCLPDQDHLGHQVFPTSEKYAETLNELDHKIEILEKKVQDLFPDNATTFILTADHGMTNDGKHGRGSIPETSTPFIVWGAGIMREDLPKDIQQVDIALLISALLGLNFPTSSIGKIPLSYLNITDEEKFDLYETNLIQIFRILEEKQNRLVKNLLVFVEFITKDDFEKDLSEVRNSKSNFNETIGAYDELYVRLLKGFEYCNDWMKFSIYLPISIGYISWIFLFFVTMLFEDESTDEGSTPDIFLKFVKLILVVYNCFIVSFFMTGVLGVSFCSYYVFPSLIIYFLSKKRKHVSRVLFKEFSSVEFVQVFLLCICVILLNLAICYDFPVILLMIFVSFLIFFDEDEQNIPKSSKYSWVSTCLTLSVLAVLKEEKFVYDEVFLISGFVLYQVFIAFFYKFIQSNRKLNVISILPEKILFVVNKVFSVLSLIISLNLITTIFFLELTSWVVVFFPFFTLLLTSENIYNKLFAMFVAFEPFLVQTAISYSLVFFTIYNLTLILWMNIETQEKITLLRKFRVCVVLLALIILTVKTAVFFVSFKFLFPTWSCDLHWNFDVRSSTVLEIAKISIPILFALCFFRNNVLASGSGLLGYMNVLTVLSNILFFYSTFHVRNIGSWREMATSFSKIGNVQLINFFIGVFYFIAYLVMTFSVKLK